ncbi:MAG: DUF4384 domain-containing protein [Gemmatimonadaceae bacterium]
MKKATWLSFALAAPMLADAQGARRASNAAVRDPLADEVPAVRVWMPSAWTYRFGAPVEVRFQVNEDAHVAVVRIDTRGRLTLLWPERRSLLTAAVAGREYRIAGQYAATSAFNADYEVGSGMVVAMASYDPIDLTAYRRLRNDRESFHYVNQQQPYYGGVRHTVERIAQEILYSPDTPFDYDIAFYTVEGGRYFAANCEYLPYDRTSYWVNIHGAYAQNAYGAYYGPGADRSYGCAPSSYYYYYSLAYCNSWVALGGFARCAYWNPAWPAPPPPPPPITGGPGPNTGMIDSIMTRPVDTVGTRWQPLERKTDQPTPNGTTRIVTMEPVREAPVVTRWLPEDPDEALTIPRLRRAANRSEDRGSGSAGGSGRVRTEDEGHIRSPGTGLRYEPAAPPRPTRGGGEALPPVRQAPRPDREYRDPGHRTDSYGASQRWERPSYSGPGGRDAGGSSRGRIDRGSASAGGSSAGASSAGSAASSGASTRAQGGGSKAADAKSSGERKPPQ